MACFPDCTSRTNEPNIVPRKPSIYRMDQATTSISINVGCPTFYFVCKPDIAYPWRRCALIWWYRRGSPCCPSIGSMEKILPPIESNEAILRIEKIDRG